MLKYTPSKVISCFGWRR